MRPVRRRPRGGRPAAATSFDGRAGTQDPHQRARRPAEDQRAAAVGDQPAATLSQHEGDVVGQVRHADPLGVPPDVTRTDTGVVAQQRRVDDPVAVQRGQQAEPGPRVGPERPGVPRRAEGAHPAGRRGLQGGLQQRPARPVTLRGWLDHEQGELPQGAPHRRQGDSGQRALPVVRAEGRAGAVQIVVLGGVVGGVLCVWRLAGAAESHRQVVEAADRKRVDQVDLGLAQRPDRQHHGDGVRRSTRSEPWLETGSKAPLPSARQTTCHGGRPPSAGSGKTSCTASRPPATRCRAKAA